AAVIFSLGVLQKFVEVLLELVETILALERFIETVKGENHVRLGLGQPFVARAEIFRAMPRGDFIAGGSEVAEDKVMLREARDDQRFQPAVMLHAICQRAAEEGKVVARIEAKSFRARR